LVAVIGGLAGNFRDLASTISQIAKAMHNSILTS